ncbi:sensor histidine kinase [Sphaerisporangium flaviroseum]|uniref:histidine kinase n=1 Tax=Sphaerisporangium flaviroseum TaxID=509199 RepID=A0ABP7HWX5_9ACTN
MRRSFRSSLRRIADVAVPVAVMIFLVAVLEDDSAGRTAAPQAIGTVAAVAQGMALCWRRSHPVQAMAITLVGGLLIQLIAPEVMFPVAGLIMIGSLAAARPPRVSLPALAALVGLTALNFRTAPIEDAQFVMLCPFVVWAFGEVLRNRRMAVEEASRRAVSEEQTRIARELHDVIAHSVSVIVVQAAAADDVFDAHPDKARGALRSIESVGRDTLGELRRLLAVVRPGEDFEPRHPQPGLDQLGELAERLRAAGLEVAVRREDTEPADPLPAGIDLSAYRIVQEALTNTLRHAGAGHAQVTVRACSGILELEVLDNGRVPGRGNDAARSVSVENDDVWRVDVGNDGVRRVSGENDGVRRVSVGGGAGRGIVGMRERAAMVGGTLDAGPLPGGGFRVHARLPLQVAR